MNLLTNKYTQLALLTLGLGLLFWAIVWVVLGAVGIHDFPIGLQLALAFLGAGLIVTKFFSSRIF